MYYPKSQIKPNLYTAGNEYFISPFINFYIGYYYETSKGEKYTGKFPGDGINRILTPSTTLSLENIDGDFNDNEIIILNTPYENYPNISLINERYNPPNNQPTNRYNPKFSPPILINTQETISRYFCKKTNELKYIEISQTDYERLKIKDPQIAWDLYEPYSITWQIKGNQESTLKANKSIVLLTEQSQKWYGFSQYLKEDYLKYYLGE
jgi:hypothetical protein